MNFRDAYASFKFLYAKAYKNTGPGRYFLQPSVCQGTGPAGLGVGVGAGAKPGTDVFVARTGSQPQVSLMEVMYSFLMLSGVL